MWYHHCENGRDLNFVSLFHSLTCSGYERCIVFCAFRLSCLCVYECRERVLCFEDRNDVKRDLFRHPLHCTSYLWFILFTHTQGNVIIIHFVFFSYFYEWLCHVIGTKCVDNMRLNVFSWFSRNDLILYWEFRVDRRSSKAKVFLLKRPSHYRVSIIC